MSINKITNAPTPNEHIAKTNEVVDFCNNLVIPTVGNGTVTITQGGTTKGSFTTNQSGNSTIELDSGSGGGSSRNIGEIIQSTIPLTDAGLHLLDGSLIYGDGIYGAFVDYIASIYSASSNYFCSESDWQTSVTNYGSCGKFVYNSTNNTVRLPKRPTIHGNLIESQDGSTWYRIYEDGWCEQGGVGATTTTITFPKEFTDTNYYFNAIKYGIDDANATEFNSLDKTTATIKLICAYNGNDIARDFMWEAKGYLAFSNYQQQTLYEYIVLANSTKTDIEVDIDEIATDLNGKADVDGSNMVSSVKNFDGQWVNSYMLVSDKRTAGDFTIDLGNTTQNATNYFPSSIVDDGYNYLVQLVVTAGHSANTTTASLSLKVENEYVTIAAANSGSGYSNNSFFVVVDSSRSFDMKIANTFGVRCNIYAIGYRRIGTNT